MAFRFRRAFYRFLPSWLTTEDGERALTSLGLLKDGWMERLRQGVTARFPDRAPNDALGLIGRDRKIVRGIDEPRAAYAVRLKRWLDDHKTRGNPFALLRQLRAYTQTDVLMRTVDNRGNWYTIEMDGDADYLLDQGNWDWDGEPTKWSRFWVIIHPTGGTDPWAEGPNLGDADLWGGAIGTPGYTIGSTATPEQVRSVRQIVREWKPDGTRGVKVIVAFDDTYFDPTDELPSAFLPDGTWDVPSNRLPDAAYWSP